MKKLKLILCVFLVICIPFCAVADELDDLLSRMPDETIMELYGKIVLEMYSRGIPSETIVQHVSSQYKREESKGTSSNGINVGDYMKTVQEVISNIPQTETIVTYDPPSTPKPTFATLIQLESEDHVWISKTGKRYHTTPDCSGMRSPSEISLSDALAKGLTPCRDCAYWMDKMGDE